MIRSAFAIVLFSLLTACAEGFVAFPVTQEAQRDLPAHISVVRLEASNINAFARPAAAAQKTTMPSVNAWDYLVGIGDMLQIIVFDHPELTAPGGPSPGAQGFGSRVQADGTFFFPFIGQVAANGRAPEVIRADVAARLADFIPSPQVEVRVAAFNSQNVVVTGEVRSPSTHPLTTKPLTLLEAVNQAGGLSERADTRKIAVQRGNSRYIVDMEAFLKEGVLENNPVLRSGDVVTVPRLEVAEAYLLGEIRRPDVIDLSRDKITLTQAVTRQGGIDQVRADARGVFVFRSDGPRITVFQLETSTPEGLLLGTKFTLHPRDVIFITRSPLQRWNDTINQLLPTVGALSRAQEL